MSSSSDVPSIKTGIIITPLMIGTLIKLFMDNIQTQGRRIRQQLLVAPAYLTEHKDEKRRVIAMKKAKEALEENDEEIRRAARNIMRERQMEVANFRDTSVPEILYPDIVRRLNSTGFFNRLLTEEGLQKREGMREAVEERKKEREQKRAEAIRIKKKRDTRNVSGSDFDDSKDDSGSGPDEAFSDGTGTLLEMQGRLNQYVGAPEPGSEPGTSARLAEPKPTKTSVKSLQTTLAKKKKSGVKKKALPKNVARTDALNALFMSTQLAPGSTPPVPSMIPGPGSGSATDVALGNVAPGGYFSGDSTPPTEVASDSGPDTRTVPEILAEKDRMSVLSDIGGTSSSSDNLPEPAINMSYNRLKYEKNIDYFVRLKKIQQIKLQDPKVHIPDILQLYAIISKTQKAISRNKLAVAKRQNDLDEKKRLLEDQKQALLVMESEARLDRLGKSEEQRLRTEQIAEDQRIRSEQIAEEATRQRDDIRADVFALMSQNSELRTIAEKVVTQLRLKKEYKNIDVQEKKKTYLVPSISRATNSQITTLISSIPEDYRGTLGPVVRSLAAGGNLDANTIIAGIVGIGLALGTGSPVAGQLGTSMFNALMAVTGFNFNDMFQAELPLSEGVDQKRESKHNAVLDLTFEHGDDPEFETDFTKIPFSDAKELPSGEEKKGFNILLGDVVTQLRAMLPNIPNRTIIDKAMNYLSSKSPAKLKRLMAIALVETKGTLRAIERNMSGPFKNSIKYMTGMDDEDARTIIRNTGILRNAMMDSIGQIGGSVMSDVRQVGDTAQYLSRYLPIPRVPRSVPPLVAPRRSDIDLGIGMGTTASATAAGLSTGSAMGAMSGVIPGMAAGAAAGGISATALRTYYRSQGVPDSRELDKKIGYLSMLPIAAVGAYLGYTPSGRQEDITGTGVVSGSGITEKKIMVDADVLEETKSKEEQDLGKNRQWAPKQIAPSPAIFDEPLQEKYAEDLETTLFDYVVPTSEGADGTILTNKLKANQYMNTQLRYTNAGVFVPRELWGQLTNTTPDTVKKLSLGQAPIIPLPQLEFMTQDFEDTWDNVARFQYVNKENTSIGLFDPYGDFSDVTNYMTVTPDSVLFTENP